MSTQQDSDQEIDQAIAIVKSRQDNGTPPDGTGGQGGPGGVGGAGGSDGTGGAGGTGGTGGTGGGGTSAEWQIPKVMAWIVAGVFAMQSVALIASVVSNINSTSKDEQERESDDCFDAFGAVVAEAAQHTRTAAARMNAAEARGLLTFIPGGGPPEAELNAGVILELIDEADQAALDDQAANQARRGWVDAGRPLPCPLESD